MSDKTQSAIAKATFTLDQVTSLISEMDKRVPNALHAMAQRTQEQGPQELSAGEWEIIRKLAFLGWASYSLTVLERTQPPAAAKD